MEMREVVPPQNLPAVEPASTASGESDPRPGPSARDAAHPTPPVADEVAVGVDEQMTLVDGRHSRVTKPNGHAAAGAHPAPPMGHRLGQSALGSPDATTFQDAPPPPLPAWQPPYDAPYAAPPAAALGGQRAHVPWQVARTWGPTTLTIGSNTAAGMSYLLGWISGVLVYFNERDNRFVRFHALQSILLSSALTVLGVAASILSALCHDLTHATHWTVFATLGSGIALLAAMSILLVWLASMIAAWTGHRWRLPIVGAYAERYAAPALPTPGSYV